MKQQRGQRKRRKRKEVNEKGQRRGTGESRRNT